MRRLVLLLMGVTIFYVSTGAVRTSSAPSLSLSPRLDQCLVLARQRPQEALAMTQQWRHQGRAMYAYATACESMVRFYQGHFTEAATGLEAVAPHLLDTLGTQGVIWAYTSACWAWLRAAQHDRAEGACTEALHLAPHDVDLLIDRAFVYVGQRKYERALSDLNQAVTYAPDLGQVYLYRSSIYRRLRRFEEALQDIDRALTLQPDDAAALLQRGNIWADLGNLHHAQRDWHKVMVLAPDTPSAAAARRNLDALNGQTNQTTNE